MILQELTDFIGLDSRTSLWPDQQDDQNILIGTSGEKYPVIEGIPIIVEDPMSFLAESYVLYGKHLMTQQDLIQEFTATFRKNPLRSSVFENVKKAIEHNMRVIKPMNDSIEPFFSKEQLLSSAISDHSPKVEYLKALRYLRRDWSGLHECEEQLKVINQTLKEAVTLLDDRESCLVLGAGLGRVACDLSESFSRMLAMDKSWAMAYLFQRLLQQNILFYDINHNNILRNIHSTRLIKTGFPYVGMEKELATIRDKFVYFVGDVRKIPLADESVSCILAVYFTDVIALEPYLAEVHRVLKKGGLFIHFGPLGYQFNAIESMFSAEEIKAFYFKLGYRHVMEKTVETKHMASYETLYNSTLTNWLFVTRKTTDSFMKQAESLSHDSVLDRVCGIQYSIEGNITVAGKENHVFRVTASNGKTYTGSESLLDFIGLIDGVKSLSAIFNTLNDMYDLTEEDRSDLRELTANLIKDGVLQIKPHKK